MDRQDVGVPEAFLLPGPSPKPLNFPRVVARKCLDGNQGPTMNRPSLDHLPVDGIRDYIEGFIPLNNSIRATNPDDPFRRRWDFVLQEEQKLQLIPPLQVVLVIVFARFRSPV